MACKVSYSYCEKEVTLINSYANNVSVGSLIHSWKKVKELRLIKGNVTGILCDFRHCEFEIEENDLKKIFHFVEKNIFLEKDIKLAIILDSPKVALVILFKRRYNFKQIKAFSTPEVAIDWMYSSY